MSAAQVRHGVVTPALARAARRVLTIGLLGVLPIVMLVTILIGSYRSGTGAWAIDFHGNFFVPGHEITRGLSPYHTDELIRVRHAVAAGHRPDEYHDGVFAAYPAPALLLGVPFSYLPQALAEWLWVGCMLLAGGLALRLVGVRDWRVYGAALLTPAAMSSVLMGSVDFLVLLGLAACWRWRDRAGRAGIALGAIIALKLIALPLVVWLIATRRWRAAVISLAASAGLIVAGWALIGFDGLAGYPHLLSLLTDIERTRGYSAVAYANLAGLHGPIAAAAPYVVGFSLAVAVWVASRRREGGDQAAFLLGVLGLIAFSPIVWHHYLVLLFVPLALYAPRFRPIWTLPLVCWFVWRGAFFYTGPVERIVFLAVIIGIAAWALFPRVRALGRRSRQQSPSAGRLPVWR